MNKIQSIINLVLAAGVVALFIIVFAVKPGSRKAVPTAEVPEGNLPIAYLNLDSLLANYTFAQDASERLMKKQEDARLKLNTKMRTFQSEYADFQRKLENNAFLSRERAESEANKLQRKQEELQDLEAKLSQEIMIENQNLNIQLADTLTSYLKEYNADGRFHMIFTNTAKDNIIMAAEGYDITNEVVEALNARYKK